VSDAPDDTERRWPDESPSNFRCDVCGRTFETEDQREDHEREDHGGPGGQEATQDNLAGDQARQPSFRESGGYGSGG
jgi:hypothetical protein